VIDNRRSVAHRREPGARSRPGAPIDAAASISPRPSLADQLVRELAANDIDTFFGVPGGAIEPLFNAIARREREGYARLVAMRSEAAAAFAADGHYRASGRVAVCTGTTGPGISNLLTGVMAAHADRVPMLVITPQVAQAKQGRGGLQDSSPDSYDMTRMLRDCTRYSSNVVHPSQLAHKLRRALIALRTQPAGPVHLSMASDLLASFAEPGPGTPLAWIPGALVDERAVARLVQAVGAARTPLLYVGDDAGMDAQGLFELAQQLGAVVISSPSGKRWIGHHDPAYAGVLGFSGHESARSAALEADVVVTFGASFDELSTNAWSAFGPGQLFAVDGHLEHMHRLPQAQPVISPTGYVIERLMHRAQTSAAPELLGSSVSKGLSALERMPAPKSVNPHRTSPKPLSRAGSIHPVALMDWLNRRLPDDVVVYADAGNSFSWSTQHLQRRRPGTYQVAMGLSSMCWAIGAAVGAAAARPRRTVCITGDGAMLMASLELTVAVQHRLPVTFVVLNDRSYGMVRHGQRLSGAETIACELAPVAFHEVAHACGAAGLRVTHLRELTLVPASYLNDDALGPCLVDVIIDRDAVPPMADRVRALDNGKP
jgi:acetolactate synthase-1/2/3 large subunit